MGPGYLQKRNVSVTDDNNAFHISFQKKYPLHIPSQEVNLHFNYLLKR